MSQLTRGKSRRLMYVENKEGALDGANARIGWVSFSKSGRTIYYRGRILGRIKGGGVSGNYFDEHTQEEYWISGVKKRGSNAHWAECPSILIDEDAQEEYDRIMKG